MTTGKSCFVIMGFGIKTDFPTGRTLDLDKSYRILIKPAVEHVGLRCIRADDIVHAGSVDLTMYRQLLQADVVVADISTCNANALYELGVRHALRPYTTITIAEDRIVYPFDVSHILIRRYQHLGVGIDAEEAERFKGELSGALRTLLAGTDTDSPVYSSLAGLRPPVLEALAPQAAEESPPAAADQTLGSLTERAEAAMRTGEFATAKALFLSARELRPDPYLSQRLALATYKSGVPTGRDALEEARTILTELDPEVSNDPETLGLWGAVHKRLWAETGDRSDLDTAVLAYERGFGIRTDHYNGINLALLLNVRARHSSPAEQIADFVDAERIRRRVIPICTALLDGGIHDEAERYWVQATLAEAHLGIGDHAAADQWSRRADDVPVADWMRATTAMQRAELAALLQPSPLDMIQDPPGQG